VTTRGRIGKELPADVVDRLADQVLEIEVAKARGRLWGYDIGHTASVR
jgi:hypothetical protein